MRFLRRFPFHRGELITGCHLVAKERLEWRGGGLDVAGFWVFVLVVVPEWKLLLADLDARAHRAGCDDQADDSMI